MVAMSETSESATSVTVKNFSLHEMSKGAGPSTNPLEPASLKAAGPETLDTKRLSPDHESSHFSLYVNDDDLFAERSQASPPGKDGQGKANTKKSKGAKSKGKGKTQPGQQNPTRQIKHLAGQLIDGQEPRTVAGRMLDLAEETADPVAEDSLDMVAKVFALEHRVETLEAMLDMHLDRMALFEQRFEQMARF